MPPRITVSPLDGRWPIVDPNTGHPTLPFLKAWQNLSGNETGTHTLASDSIPSARLINTTGPIEGGGPLTDDLTLFHATSGVTAGTYGDATDVARITVDDQGHITAIANVTITGGGGGGGSTPTVRSNATTLLGSVASAAVSWPASTGAGDVVILLVGHGFSVSTPAGWSPLCTPTNAANWNGAVFGKVMTSADITAGSVTLTFGGTFEGVVSAVTLNGATVNSYVTSAFLQSTSGATSASELLNLVKTTDLLICVASTRASTACAITNGGATALSSQSGTNASGAVASLTGGSGVFGITITNTFGAAGTGYYVAVVAFR